MDNEPTTTFKVSAIGLKDEIEARQFQEAAQSWLETRGLKAVRSIFVDDQQEGAIEFLGCKIVDGKLIYDSYAIHNLYDESEETMERLDFYASASEESYAATQ